MLIQKLILTAIVFPDHARLDVGDVRALHPLSQSTGARPLLLLLLLTIGIITGIVEIGNLIQLIMFLQLRLDPLMGGRLLCVWLLLLVPRRVIGLLLLSRSLLIQRFPGLDGVAIEHSGLLIAIEGLPALVGAED